MRIALFAALLLTACGARAPVVEAASARPARPWRIVATEADRTRLRDWRSAWMRGLQQARSAGHGAEIAREGALLTPDAALEGAGLPNGDYRCRVIKIGSPSTAGLAYVPYPAFACRVRAEGALQHFTKLTGSQRPVGHIYPDGEVRAVFLGTLMLSDERMAMRYGQDSQRDLAGAVERIGPRRWRMVLPFPRFESLVDVIELVPTS